METTNYTGIRFNDNARWKADMKLQELQQIIDISWGYVGDELLVNGLDNEPVTFTCLKSVRVFVDGFISGFNVGLYAQQYQMESENVG